MTPLPLPLLVEYEIDRINKNCNKSRHNFTTYTRHLHCLATTSPLGVRTVKVRKDDKEDGRRPSFASMSKSHPTFNASDDDENLWVCIYSIGDCSGDLLLMRNDFPIEMIMTGSAFRSCRKVDIV